MIKPVYFYCQKVLPLVYDESLSYYEVLCKMRDKLNEVIELSNSWDDQYKQLQEAIQEIQKWIDDFDTTYIEQLIQEKLATMIFVEITNAGYIAYNIPETWDSITFNTTGLDIELELQPEYGHLVLSY